VTWYVFTEPRLRGRIVVGGSATNLAARTHDACVRMLERKCRERNEPLAALVLEVNDPRRMSADEQAQDRRVMDPRRRLRFMDRLGYRAVDPARFSYIQPQLTATTK